MFKTRFIRLLCKYALIACLILLFWFVYVQWKIQMTQQQFAFDSADTGIVLGAALWDNVPSPALRERLDLAFSLYSQGYYANLIVSGGLDHNGSTLTEAAGMKTYLIHKGVAEANILTEDKATNTFENLLFSQKIMNSHAWENAIIVTHQYHALRALEMAEFIGMQHVSVSSTDSRVMWMPWHKARETLAYTKWKLAEILMLTGLMPKER